MTNQFDTWKRYAMEDIENFKHSMDPIKRFEHSSVVRAVFAYVCAPFLCFPCICCSLGCRILYCCQPINPHTVGSDKCIKNCCDAIDKQQPHTKDRFKPEDLVGTTAEQLRPVMDAFFEVMDTSQWKYHMVDWLDSQLRLFGYKFNPEAFVPAQARDIVNALLDGRVPDVKPAMCERSLGALMERANHLKFALNMKIVEK